MAQPFNDRVPIINPDGTPSQFFIRQLQERGITVDNKITAEQAQALIDAWALQRDINTTSPITGGGNLSVDLNIGFNGGLDVLNDVDVTTTPPADGQVLGYDLASSQWIPMDQTGGSGSPIWLVTATGTGASQGISIPETSPSDQAVMVFVNGIRYETDEYSISGTTLTVATNAAGDSIEIIGIFGGGGSGGGGGSLELDYNPPTTVTLPLIQNSTTGIASSSTTDVTGKGLHITMTPTTGTNRHMRRVMVAPSLPFTMTARIVQTPSSAGDQFDCGIILRNNGLDQEIRLRTTDNLGSQVFVQKWTGDGFSSTITSGPYNASSPGVYTFWLRMAVDAGGNVTTFISFEGLTWRNLGTVTTIAAQITSLTHVGIYMRSSNNTALSGFLCPYFVIS